VKPPPGAGILFANKAKSGFLSLTGSRYDSMVTRMVNKKLPPLPFTKQEFRVHVLAALGGHEDGAIQCKYCRKVCTLSEVSADHETPLSRDGSSGLDNLGYPCQNCNQAKGSLTPEEFKNLLYFLEKYIPLGRRDVLGRLAKANKLAAGARRNAMLLKGRAPKKQQPADDGMPEF
jgi:hypothetical protein